MSSSLSWSIERLRFEPQIIWEDVDQECSEQGLVPSQSAVAGLSSLPTKELKSRRDVVSEVSGSPHRAAI